MRCDGVLLGRDPNSSLASLDAEKLVRDLPWDAVEDHDVSSDSLSLCPVCLPYVKDVEGLDESAEGVEGRGFLGARNPSLSKKTSRAPGVHFSFFVLLSDDLDPFPLENIFLSPEYEQSNRMLLNPLFTPAQSCLKDCDIGQSILSIALLVLV